MNDYYTWDSMLEIWKGISFLFLTFVPVILVLMTPVVIFVFCEEYFKKRKKP